MSDIIKPISEFMTTSNGHRVYINEFEDCVLSFEGSDCVLTEGDLRDMADFRILMVECYDRLPREKVERLKRL